MSVITIGKASSESECRRELAETQARLYRAQAQLAARAYEATELNHRIANSLQLASSFLQLQQRHLRDETAKAALTIASSRIEAVAKLHRHLAEQGSAAQVDLGNLLRQIGPEMALSTGMTCEVQADTIEVTGEAAMQLAVAVNELVINASKHAYAGRDDGVVHIECRREPDDMIRLSVADGGPGLTDGFNLDEETGLGFTILNGVVRQLGGRISAETDGGAKFTLCVPRSRLQPSSRAYSASGTP